MGVGWRVWWGQGRGRIGRVGDQEIEEFSSIEALVKCCRSWSTDRAAQKSLVALQRPIMVNSRKKQRVKNKEQCVADSPGANCI